MDGKTALALLGGKKKSRTKHNSRKVGRNYRWGAGPDGKSETHSQTKYRLRHGIGPGPRKREAK
jgi:hypothetical protein